MSVRLAVRPRQLIKVQGWTLARSAAITTSRIPIAANVVTVPVHARDVKRGILSGILADAGISHDEFLKALKGVPFRYGWDRLPPSQLVRFRGGIGG